MSDLPNPGDLAYIVREVPACQENIGEVVTVCENQSTPDGYDEADPGHVWVTCKRPLAGLRGWSKLIVEPGEPCTILRVWLRKIAGPSTPTETTTDLEVTA